MAGASAELGVQTAQLLRRGTIRCAQAQRLQHVGYAGQGLGLAMVKRMVEQAGGTVRFETHVGEGSTFFLTLPLEMPH